MGCHVKRWLLTKRVHARQSKSDTWNEKNVEQSKQTTSQKFRVNVAICLSWWNFHICFKLFSWTFEGHHQTNLGVKHQHKQRRKDFGSTWQYLSDGSFSFVSKFSARHPGASIKPILEASKNPSTQLPKDFGSFSFVSRLSIRHPGTSSNLLWRPPKDK